MITGDHALTGLHVAKELDMADWSTALLDTPAGESGTLTVKQWDRESGRERASVQIDGSSLGSASGLSHLLPKSAASFCLTGPAFELLMQHKSLFMKDLLHRVSVFARFSPSNKASAGSHDACCYWSQFT